MSLPIMFGGNLKYFYFHVSPKPFFCGIRTSTLSQWAAF